MAEHNCTLCTKIYKTAYGLRQHKKAAHGPANPTLHCKVCQRTLTTAQKLIHHKKTYQHFTIEDVVSPQTKTFICPHCNFQTNFQSKLNIHNRQNHSTVKKDIDFLDLLFEFECPYLYCKAKAYSKDIMQYHFFKVHATNETYLQHVEMFAYTLCKKCNTSIPNEYFKKHNMTCLKT